MRHIFFAAILAVLSGTSAVGAGGNTTVPMTINGATISYSGNQITSTGSGFSPTGAAPNVKFNGGALTITAFTNTTLTANLPANTAAGSYAFSVANNKSAQVDGRITSLTDSSYASYDDINSATCCVATSGGLGGGNLFPVTLSPYTGTLPFSLPVATPLRIAPAQ